MSVGTIGYKLWKSRRAVQIPLGLTRDCSFSLTLSSSNCPLEVNIGRNDSECYCRELVLLVRLEKLDGRTLCERKFFIHFSRNGERMENSNQSPSTLYLSSLNYWWLSCVLKVALQLSFGKWI
jgi:hypothetical protein